MDTFSSLLGYKTTDYSHNKKIALENIKKLNHILNAFCQIYEKDLDGDSPAPTPTLNGCIVSIKDLFCYKDHPVQAASKILDGFISPYSSTSVQRLLDNGARIIGHTNCDEFGMGGSNEHSLYGSSHNYLDTTKTPGGSSGGAAVAVQADMCHVSLGTDTGGSVRQPAAFCGVIGFKPSYGVISRWGVVAHASSFDTVGLLAKKINYIEDVFKVICGFDEKDLSMSRDYTYTPQRAKERYNIAYLEDTLSYPSLQEEIKTSTDSFLKDLKSQGHKVEAVSCDLLKYAVAVYYVLTTTEASSNLARYDGIRYGYRTKQYTDYQDLITKTRTEGFGEEVQRRLLCGNYIFDTRETNHYYSTAIDLRQAFKNYFTDIFRKYDFIVLPTTATTAFKIHDCHITQEQMWLSDIFTVIASIGQVPAISIPYGHDNDNMPIGMQIIANQYHDNSLLTFCKSILKC